MTDQPGEVLGKPILEFDISFSEVTKDSRISLRCNSFIIKNTGEKTATLDDLWTLAQNEVVGLNMTSPNEVIAANIKVMFSGAGATQGIMIMEALAKHPHLAHYIKQPKAI